MPSDKSAAFEVIVYVVIAVLCAYGGGRIHQWYKHSMDRDVAFREGYNHGYRMLFQLATRRTRPGPDAEVKDGRDGLMSEPRYRSSDS
jgi:hypothetical protein